MFWIGISSAEFRFPKKNDFGDLNISRYIDTSEEEVIIDIKATMEDISKLEVKEQEIDSKLNGYLKSLGL